MISPEQSGDIKKNYCGHKIELFLDNLGNQELDNLRDHKQSGNTKLELITESLGHRTDTTVHKYLSLDEVRMKACALSLKEAQISYKGGAFYA